MELTYPSQRPQNPSLSPYFLLFERFSEAEKWLSEREKVRLDPDNINRPDTAWVFENHYNVDIKVVLDRQPLLGTGLLPKWLSDCARGRAGSMIALDTYKDNLCLWRCIAVHRGSRPDRSTTAARELAKSFFNLIATPQDCRKTCLDELDEVEKHLNKKQISKDWLGIRVYEPVRMKDGEVVWYQVDEHFDNWNSRRACFYYKRYFEACKNLCMYSLPFKIY